MKFSEIVIQDVNFVRKCINASMLQSRRIGVVFRGIIRSFSSKMDGKSVTVGGKEILALRSDQVICYEGCARMTVLAGNVSVNGYVISSEQTSKCSLHSPSGFPCHAIHSAEQPHIFANSAPPPQTDFQELVDTISGRSGLAAENQQQLRLFLQEIVQSEDSVTSVIQLEEKVDGVNRLLSGSCGLGHFYSSSQQDSDRGKPAAEDHGESAGAAGSTVDTAASADDRQPQASASNASNCTTPSRRQLWPGFFLCSPLNSSPLILHSHWRETINAITSSAEPPTVMVCGARNTGKSSFGRLLVNSLLNSHRQVAFLETDVGQTELTAPATMSIHCLSEPLIGPPYCHQMPPERSIFFGDVSPADQPDFYVRCACELVDVYLNKLQPGGIPLVVNTHGWVKGLGIALVKEVYRLVKPRHLVAFASDGARSAEWVPEILGGRSSDESDSSSVVHYVPVHEVAEGTRSIQSKTFRHLAVVASMEPLLRRSSLYQRNLSSPLPVHASQLLQSIRPKEVPWNRVAVHVMHASVPRSQIMYALNGSLVMLGSTEDTPQFINVEREICEGAPFFLPKNPVSNCIGLAVIHSIDMSRKSFYILTSLSEEDLQKVNLILKGRLDLAPAFLEAPGRKRPPPYVSSDFPHNVMGAGAMKHRRNLKRR